MLTEERGACTCNVAWLLCCMTDDPVPISTMLCCSDLGVSSIGPPSASLLQDWLGIDVGQLNPEDMDAMEKELEAGAPDMFFNDL